MSHREQVIVQLLERYAELTDPMRAGNGDGFTGYLRMPPTYDDSVRELERLLRAMRDDRHASLLRAGDEKVSLRACWWHVNERYLRATSATKTLSWRRGKWLGLSRHEAVIAQPGGWELALADERTRRRHGLEQRMQVRVTRWDPAVVAWKVDRGIEWLGESWALGHEPMLPKELMVA